MKKNSLLTLDADIFGPSDKASEVSDWLDVTSDSKVARSLLEQRTLNLSCTSLGSGGGGNNLLTLSNFLHLHAYH